MTNFTRFSVSASVKLLVLIAATLCGLSADGVRADFPATTREAIERIEANLRKNAKDLLPSMQNLSNGKLKDEVSKGFAMKYMAIDGILEIMRVTPTDNSRQNTVMFCIVAFFYDPDDDNKIGASVRLSLMHTARDKSELEWNRGGFGIKGKRPVTVDLVKGGNLAITDGVIKYDTAKKDGVIMPAAVVDVHLLARRIGTKKETTKEEIDRNVEIFTDKRGTHFFVAGNGEEYSVTFTNEAREICVDAIKIGAALTGSPYSK